MQLLLVFLAVHAVSSILIGKMDNCSYTAANASTMRFNGTNCDSCVCDALLLYRSSFVALNCVGDGYQCELFVNESASSDWLLSRNSTCYFYPELTRSATLSGMMLCRICLVI